MSETINVGSNCWNQQALHEVFYTQGCERSSWLEHYASVFNHVEINESFYKLPSREQILTWLQATPDDFQLTLTAPRTISHYKKLKNCETQLTQMFTRLNGMEDRIHSILFCLPQHWRVNLRRLSEFLERLSSAFRYVIEPGDNSWLNDDVFAVLKRHNIALCLRGETWARRSLATTADFVYVKLTSNPSSATGRYHPRTLRGWAFKAKGLQREGKRVTFSFSGADPVAATKNAIQLRNQLAGASTS